MGEKDITEKNFIEHNDIFADIINCFLFDGEHLVDPDDLENSNIQEPVINLDGKIHKIERDICKKWKSKATNFVILGIENQTLPDKTMPFRIMEYDALSYKRQLITSAEEIAPIVTIVLYYGDRNWNYPCSIKELMSDIPDPLNQYVNDYKIKVINVTNLTKDEINKLESDFKYLAIMLNNLSKRADDINRLDLDTNSGKIKYTDDFINLVSALLGEDVLHEVKKKLNKKGGSLELKNIFHTFEDSIREEEQQKAKQKLEEEQQVAEQKSRNTAVYLKGIGLSTQEIAKALEKPIELIDTWTKGVTTDTGFGKLDLF